MGWRKKWQPTPVFSPGEPYGQRNVEGYAPLRGGEPGELRPYGGKESIRWQRVEHHWSNIVAVYMGSCEWAHWKSILDGIPVELFQILKDDAVKVLHEIYQQIWKIQQWPQYWKSSVFITVPRKGNAKECSNYYTIALISYVSKVMLKIL